MTIDEQGHDKISKEEASLFSMNMLTTVVLSVCASLIAVMLALHYFVPAPTPKQEFRILDIAALSVMVANRYTDTKEGEEAMRRAFKRIQALQDEGVIILRAQQVVFAPKPYHLDLAQLIAEDPKAKE